MPKHERDADGENSEQDGDADKCKRTKREIRCSEDNCNFSCQYPSRLTQHLWQKHSLGDEQWFPCPQDGCEYKAKQNADLHRHLWQVHSLGDEQWFPCPQDGCEYKAKQNSILTKHLWRAHNIGGQWFPCLENGCGYKCKSNSDLTRHIGNVHSLRGQQRRKKKEERMARALTKSRIIFDREVRVNFDCALGTDRGQKWANIDFVVQREDKVTFLIENDEYEHSADGYQLSCECRRMADATTSLLCAQPEIEHIVWVRFNPDSFTTNGVKQKVKVCERFNRLFEFLKNYNPSRRFEIAYLYYSTVNENGTLIPIIFQMPDFPEALRPHAFAL